MQTVTMKVKGMTCGGCVASVERVLSDLDGVDKVDVSLQRGEATVEYAPERVRESQLREAIEDAGFHVE
ncbi:MAG TPA: heavy-metal-associated domain-containing protein [Burkholderiales bacterium]|nr:heavy-metal-associated domain-containing protein [Burkholderiales bacterium]